jgi:hypothetical protein
MGPLLLLVLLPQPLLLLLLPPWPLLLPLLRLVPW